MLLQVPQVCAPAPCYRRYPKSVQLLRAYAGFLESVKNDPWAAAQYYTDADKQESAQENANEGQVGGRWGGGLRQGGGKRAGGTVC